MKSEFQEDDEKSQLVIKAEIKGDSSKDLKLELTKFDFIVVNIFPHLCMVALLVFSCTNYYESLTGCQSKIPQQCLEFFNEQVVKQLSTKIIVSSAFCISSIAVGYVFRSFVWLKTFIAASILVWLYNFSLDLGFDFQNHGGYNMVFFCLSIVGFIVILALLFLITHYFILYPIIVFGILAFTSIITYFSARSYLFSSCKDWKKGFFDYNAGKYTEVLDTPGCALKTPTYCSESLFYGWFDLTKFTNFNCENHPNNKWYFDKNIKKVGYPRTENWGLNEPEMSTYGWKIHRTVFSQIVNENEEKFNQTEAVVTNNNDGTGKLEINLKFNKELSELRKAMVKSLDPQAQKKLPKNVLIIFIDAASRVHFKKMMPKTFDYLNSYYKNKTSHFSTYQFFKFHSLEDYSNPNLIPFYNGIAEKDNNYERVQNSENFMTKYAKKGYVTGSSLDMCNKDVFDNLGQPILLNLPDPVIDHELFQMFCDGNYINKNNFYSIWKGHYSFFQRCLYGKSAQEYTFEYAKQFYTKYKDNNSIFRIGLMESHEGSGEVLKYSDDGMLNFLKEMFDQGGILSQNSALYFFADHHFTMPGVYAYYKFEDFMLERYLPFLFIGLTKDLEDFELYDKNLLLNENNLITHYDSNMAMLSLIGESSYPTNLYGKSFFNFNLAGSDRCSSYPEIPQEQCRCKAK